MSKISREPFGITRNGKQVDKFILINSAGTEVHLLTWGCGVQKLLFAGKDGIRRDVILGYDTLEGYENGTVFHGIVAGRYANRILGAAFTLDGKEYHLEKNDGNNHLHGTFAHTVFDAEPDESGVTFSYVSPDGEEGYPGTLTLKVRYELTEDSILRISYHAETDAPTVLNLTNHSYFNLNGQTGKTIADHELKLYADEATEVGEGTVPTGKISSVKGTPLDFTEGKTVGKDLESKDPQIVICCGFDHNFIINGEPGTLRPAARLESRESGIAMECWTTQPGMQFYSGNFLAGDAAPFGKNGVRYPKNGGLALETQHYPCSPNFPEFPTTELRPGELFEEQTEYRFFSI